MGTLKQIEVNGTTYDIGVAGSELPVICETYEAGENGNSVLDNMMEGAPSGVTYHSISPEYLLKVKDLGNGDYARSIVLALQDSVVYENL